VFGLAGFVQAGAGGGGDPEEPAVLVGQGQYALVVGFVFRAPELFLCPALRAVYG
jgi:hypothetical protein